MDQAVSSMIFILSKFILRSNLNENDDSYLILKDQLIL